MSTLLILTTGTTDVQIVMDNKRHELSKNKCGELLDQLVNRSYSFCDLLLEKETNAIESLPKDDLHVCTPKLDAVLRSFKEQLPDAVLILETGRGFESDPRQAGAVLEKRLRERGMKQVCRQVFLKGQERLENSENESDAVVRREVVSRLAGIIQNVFTTRNPTHIYMALAGGIPEANDVVNELVRLYAVANPCQVTSLKVPDGTKIKREDKAVPEPFHPAAGIRARWHALDLIQKGNLLAAWGAVSHLENQPGQEWTKVVRWLADFAASLPIADECDIAVLKHPTMAVRAALRVELALRAGDIPRAVHGTVSFFEAALWDWLRRRDFATDDHATGGNLSNGFTFASKPDEKRFRQKGGKWYIKDFYDGQQAWVSVLNKPALAGYFNALTDDIRNLRHDVAHNEPTQALMQQARKCMQGANLWSTNNPLSFMSQPLVQEVLRELGEQNPETLHTQLIEDIRSRLLTISG